MAEPLTRLSARGDDLPVLWAPLDRVGVRALLDEYGPTPGHWGGLRLGWGRVRWWTSIRSAGEQRLQHVAPGAQHRLHTRREGTGQPVPPVAVGDDRLATGREAVRDARRWRAWEGARHQHAWRVYDLPPAGVRRARTTASGAWSVTAAGLWPCGPRQDHGPARPQGKSMRSALEPRGLPVATAVVPGPRAEAPLEGPAIPQVRERLGRCGRLSGGDAPRAALDPRAPSHAGGDDDVGPWSESQRPPVRWAGARAPVWTGEPTVSLLHRQPPDSTRERRAAGGAPAEPVPAAVAGTPSPWLERRLGLRSCQLARAGAPGRRARLAPAQAESTALQRRGRGRRHGPDPTARRAAVATTRGRSRVQGWRRGREKAPRGERPGRRQGRRAATGRRAGDVPGRGSRDPQAVAAVVRQVGGRVSGTTPPAAPRSLQAAVLAYRHASRVERARGRLPGRPVSLTPLELARDDPATGLSRVWSLGVRGLTRLACRVRQRVATAKTTLAGVDVGHPTRTTARPTAERRLQVFPGRTRTLIREGRRRRRHLTPLSRVHHRILTLLDFPADIDTRLCPDSHQPP
jgi:hypothetical protein